MEILEIKEGKDATFRNIRFIFPFSYHANVHACRRIQWQDRIG